MYASGWSIYLNFHIYQALDTGHKTEHKINFYDRNVQICVIRDLSPEAMNA